MQGPERGQVWVHRDPPDVPAEREAALKPLLLDGNENPLRVEQGRQESDLPFQQGPSAEGRPGLGPSGAASLPGREETDSLGEQRYFGAFLTKFFKFCPLWQTSTYASVASRPERTTDRVGFPSTAFKSLTASRELSTAAFML